MISINTYDERMETWPRTRVTSRDRDVPRARRITIARAKASAIRSRRCGTVVLINVPSENSSVELRGTLRPKLVGVAGALGARHQLDARAPRPLLDKPSVGADDNQRHGAEAGGERLSGVLHELARHLFDAGLERAQTDRFVSIEVARGAMWRLMHTQMSKETCSRRIVERRSCTTSVSPRATDCRHKAEVASLREVVRFRTRRRCSQWRNWGRFCVLRS